MRTANAVLALVLTLAVGCANDEGTRVASGQNPEPERPPAGYYLVVRASLSPQQIDEVHDRTIGGPAIRRRPVSDAEHEAYMAELDRAWREEAESLAAEARRIGYTNARVAADPGLASGCNVGCWTGAPAQGYVVLMDGPFPGPEPGLRAVRDKTRSGGAKSQAMTRSNDFERSKSAEAYPEAKRAASARLAERAPTVTFVDFDNPAPAP